MTIRKKKAGLYIIIKADFNQPGTAGYFYVGSSLNINRRFTEHKRDLKTGNHKNPRLQQLWNDFMKDQPPDTGSFNI